MSGLNQRTANLLQAQVRALHVATGCAAAGLPVSSSITALLRHGGVYTLVDREMMASRLTALASTGASPTIPMDVPFLMAQAGGSQASFSTICSART